MTTSQHLSILRQNMRQAKADLKKAQLVNRPFGIAAMWVLYGGLGAIGAFTLTRLPVTPSPLLLVLAATCVLMIVMIRFFPDFFMSAKKIIARDSAERFHQEAVSVYETALHDEMRNLGVDVGTIEVTEGDLDSIYYGFTANLHGEPKEMSVEMHDGEALVIVDGRALNNKSFGEVLKPDQT